VPLKLSQRGLVCDERRDSGAMADEAKRTEVVVDELKHRCGVRVNWPVNEQGTLTLKAAKDVSAQKVGEAADVLLRRRTLLRSFNSVKFCVIIVLKFKNYCSDVIYVWFSSSVPLVSRAESFVLRHGISGEVW
jgi:hypothetical protein